MWAQNRGDVSAGGCRTPSTVIGDSIPDLAEVPFPFRGSTSWLNLPAGSASLGADWPGVEAEAAGAQTQGAGAEADDWSVQTEPAVFEAEPFSLEAERLRLEAEREYRTLRLKPSWILADIRR